MKIKDRRGKEMNKNEKEKGKRAGCGRGVSGTESKQRTVCEQRVSIEDDAGLPTGRVEHPIVGARAGS